MSSGDHMPSWTILDVLTQWWQISLGLLVNDILMPTPHEIFAQKGFYAVPDLTTPNIQIKTWESNTGRYVYNVLTRCSRQKLMAIAASVNRMEWQWRGWKRYHEIRETEFETTGCIDANKIS